MTAKKWHKEFLSRYQKDRNIQKLEKRLEEKGSYGTEDSDWTVAMKNLLHRMARSMNYQVEDESRVVGGGRADQRWLKGKGSAVAIEHENRADKNLTGEINKLCNDVSKLKVLMTYVSDGRSDKEFKRNVETIRKKVKDAIDAHIDTFTGEFLLLISGCYVQPRVESWKAFRSALNSRLEPLP